jgi:hypothetical protein
VSIPKVDREVSFMLSITTIIAFIFGGGCGATSHPRVRQGILHGCKVVFLSEPMRKMGRGLLIAGYSSNPYVPPIQYETMRYYRWRQAHPETPEQEARCMHKLADAPSLTVVGNGR